MTKEREAILRTIAVFDLYVLNTPIDHRVSASFAKLKEQIEILKTLVVNK